MTDNGSCYRSTLFTDPLGPGVVDERTEPYRPHTGIGGKSPIERLNVHNLTVKNS